MLRAEFICQEFNQRNGPPMKTSWPIGLNEAETAEILSIAGAWTENTRKGDKIDGANLWTVRCLPLLVTVLQSWKRERPWVKWILQCLEYDPEMTNEWEMRLVWREPVLVDEDVLSLADIEFPIQTVDEYPQFQLQDTEQVDIEALRENRRAHAIVKAMFKRIHAEEDLSSAAFFIEDISEDETLPAVSSGPKDFSSDEINFLINNLGQEDVLW